MLPGSVLLGFGRIWYTAENHSRHFVAYKSRTDVLIVFSKFGFSQLGSVDKRSCSSSLRICCKRDLEKSHEVISWR